MGMGRAEMIFRLRIEQELANRELERRCAADPLFWMQNGTRTRDDHYRDKGTLPFDRLPQKPYFPKLFEVLRSGPPRLFIPKSREMLLSWAVIGYAVWLCQWHQGTHVIVQSEKGDKAKDLVSGTDKAGYARVLWEQQEPYLRLKHPLTRKSSEMAGDFLTWKNNSLIQAVPGGADQASFCVEAGSEGGSVRRLACF